ncbi:hypothetical protein ACLK17_11725 [Escherichia coli]
MLVVRLSMSAKRRDLKKRLSSYFRSNLASRKTEALVAQISKLM